MNKWIILDRDGVINYDSDQYIKSPDEWIPIPGSLEAIAKLNWAGYHVVIASNQSGIAKGLFTDEILELIHKKMENALFDVGGHTEGFFYCAHNPEDNCICRKPKIGLLTAIAQEYKIKLTETYLIGDSIRDIEAAKTAGCIPILVLSGNGEKTMKTEKNNPILKKIRIYSDLAQATEAIIQQENHKISL